MANEKPGEVETPPPAKTDATHCTASQAAELLSSESGQRIEAAWIAADVGAGAPVNGDGTVNLIVYCAWLLSKGD